MGESELWVMGDGLQTKRQTNKQKLNINTITRPKVKSSTTNVNI